MSSFNAYLSKRIKYLEAPDLLQPMSNDDHFIELVTFLENRLIRTYKIEDRAELTKYKGPLGKWKPVFEKYLQATGAESEVLDSLKTKDWKQPTLQYLLDIAVEFHHKDKQAEKELQKAAEDNSDLSKQLENLTTGPWQHFDTSGAEFQDSVSKLATFLNIPKQEPNFVNHETLFSTCVTCLQNRFENRRQVNDPKSFKMDSIDTVKCGFDTGDNQVNKIGKLLRLLHIRNFRSFQNLINKIIVGVQEYTANPKTDQSLSKVGVQGR